jgi:hypothetical protein
VDSAISINADLGPSTGSHTAGTSQPLPYTSGLFVLPSYGREDATLSDEALAKIEGDADCYKFEGTREQLGSYMDFIEDILGQCKSPERKKALRQAIYWDSNVEGWLNDRLGNKRRKIRSSRKSQDPSTRGAIALHSWVSGLYPFKMMFAANGGTARCGL